jgi:6-phosphofructokinase
MEQHQRLAILVGGGPAPGINSVIAAATIRARLEGLDVIGIRDGFEWLMQGDIDHVTPLTIDAVSRIHFRGGSTLGIARANPTTDPALLERTVQALLRLNVTQLITIGGDDTAFSAMKLELHAAGAIRVVHVPKTIDNDLDLPAHIDTFGYQTARHYGVEIVKNLMVDAKTTSRWHVVVAMGRKTGHLALGIGKAAGATVTLVDAVDHLAPNDQAQRGRRCAPGIDGEACEGIQGYCGVKFAASIQGKDTCTHVPRAKETRPGGLTPTEVGDVPVNLSRAQIEPELAG